MKKLIKQDKEFEAEYLATKESIIVFSLTIIAISSLLITVIIKYL